jgi:hypothetical protein
VREIACELPVCAPDPSLLVKERDFGLMPFLRQGVELTPTGLCAQLRKLGAGGKLLVPEASLLLSKW